MSESQELDLIIRGAHVIDPGQKIDGVTDVGIRHGVIEKVGRFEEARGAQEINGTGLYASPGWVDLHAHVFSGANAAGVHPDREAGVASGVTTVVDAGTSGAGTWRTFQEAVVASATTRVLAFMNVSLIPTSGPRHGDWQNFSQGQTIRLAELEAKSDRCLGIKVLASQTHCGDLGIEPVKLARQAARLSGTGLMVHIGNAPPVIQDVLDLLGDGDIVTHCWHGKPGGLLDRNGEPLPETLTAIDRGVKFDIGHGSASFSLDVARRALDAGLPIHAISTDIHQGNIRGPVHDMATTMSKFLHLGLDLGEVVRLSTLSPAQLIHHEEEFGSLSPGCCADMTLFRVAEREVEFIDSEGNSELAGQLIEVAHTIRAGAVVRNC